MRALVTGACGFAGGHLLKHLVDSGDEVAGTFFVEPPPHHPVHSLKVRREPLDVTNSQKCLALIDHLKPDVVYHLAGMAFVPEAEESFEKALVINTVATSNIARALSLVGKPATLMFASSAEVYGRFLPEELPLHEELALRPHNNYSISKIAAELAAQRYQRAPIKIVTIRPFNHIGPGQNERFVASSFARQLALMKLGKQPSTMRVGNLSARRDFTDVRDIVRGYRLAALHGEGLFNLCSGKAVPIEQVLRMLCDVSGVKVTIEQDPALMRPLEVPMLYGSYTKAQSAFQWRPEISLERTLRDIFEDWVKRLSA